MANILHVASGSIYAGLESQLLNTVVGLSDYSDHQVQVLLFHDKLLSHWLRQHGITVRVIPVNFLNYPAALIQIRKLLLAEKVDLVHTHGYKANIAVHQACIGIHDLKRVRTEHGLSEPFKGLKLLKYKLYAYYDRRIAELHTDKVIAVSKEIYQHLSGFLCPERVVFLQNSIGTAEKVSESQVQNLRKKLKIGTDNKLIGTIGRFVPVKNQFLFVDLICELAKSDPAITGLIVGEGPLEQELRAYAGDRNISDRVVFTGFREDIPVVLRALEILVFTSRHEGLPMVLLEAMNQGTPVVAVNVGGLKEVLSDYSGELLADSHSPTELAQKCLRILNDPQLRDKIATALKNKARRDYSLEQYIGKLVELYDDILG